MLEAIRRFIDDLIVALALVFGLNYLGIEVSLDAASGVYT